MFNIDKFLEKFSKKVQYSEQNKKEILDIIEKNIGIKISGGDVEIKNYVIYTKTSPGVRNQIFINKNKILEDIGKSITLKILDIR